MRGVNGRAAIQPKPSKATAKTLLEAFLELLAPRVRERCAHLLHEVLVIAVCGMLVGGESFYDMEDLARESESWLRGFLLLPGGVPRHGTFTNLATLRRITLNLLRADKSSSKSLNRKRLRCALVPD